MADQINKPVARIQGIAQDALHNGQLIVNRYLPQERRSRLWTTFLEFLRERPVLASFLISQLAISGPVLTLFLTSTLAVLLFSTLGAVILGIFSGIVFIASAVGFAVIFVLPTLLFTTLLATFFWLWAVATFIIVRYIYQTMPDVQIHADLNSKSTKRGTKIEGTESAREDIKGLDHQSSQLTDLRAGNQGDNHVEENSSEEGPLVENVMDSIAENTSTTSSGPANGSIRKNSRRNDAGNVTFGGPGRINAFADRMSTGESEKPIGGMN